MEAMTSSVRNVRAESRAAKLAAEKAQAKRRSGSVQRLMHTYLRPLDEARALPAAHLGEMPAVTVLELEVPGWSGPVWLRSDLATSQVGADVVLGRDIWALLVEAAEADRIYLSDFRTILGRIHAGDVLSREDVLGPVRPERPRHWTVGQVLARIGARLFSVRVEDAVAFVETSSANTLPLQEAG